MKLTPSETCEAIANIIDSEPERFNMRTWELQTECGTTACIAGHTALLHSDGLDANAERVSEYNGRYKLIPDSAWKARQARRLGLTPTAGNYLFNWDDTGKGGRGNPFSKVLRRLEKELDGRSSGYLIGGEELDRIITDALS